MAFLESPRFPDDIARGSRGGPGFRTSVIELDSGKEERVSHWSSPRYVFDVSYGIRNFTDLREVIDFYQAVRGASIPFRFKDWGDYSTHGAHLPSTSTPTSTDSLLGVGDGTTTTFQLIKKYTIGGLTTVRNITKPVSGTVLVSKDDVAQGSGWSVDTTTGLVTFTAAPANGVLVKGGCDFDVPVRFGLQVDRAFMIAHDAFNGGSLPPIELVEVISETPVAEDRPSGGSAVITLAASGTFTRATGELLLVTATTTGLTYTQFENEVDVPKGKCHHRIVNAGANTFAIHGRTSGLITNLAAGQRVDLGMAAAAGGLRQWAAYL